MTTPEEAARRKAISDALQVPFAKADISQRSGGKAGSFKYVDWPLVNHRLIDATENCYDLEVKVQFFIGDVWCVLGEMTIPGLGTRAGMGVQRVTFNAANNMVAEDLIKGAISDLLKVCASKFGVALDLYGDDPEGQGDDAGMGQNRDTQSQGQRQGVTERPRPTHQQASTQESSSGITPAQRDFIESLIMQHRVDPMGIGAWCMMKGSLSEIDGLTRSQAGELLNILQSDKRDQFKTTDPASTLDLKLSHQDGEALLRQVLGLDAGDDQQQATWEKAIKAAGTDLESWRVLFRNADQAMKLRGNTQAWRWVMLIESAPLAGDEHPYAVIDGLAARIKGWHLDGDEAYKDSLAARFDYLSASLAEREATQETTA